MDTRPHDVVQAAQALAKTLGGTYDNGALTLACGTLHIPWTSDVYDMFEIHGALLGIFLATLHRKHGFSGDVTGFTYNETNVVGPRPRRWRLALSVLDTATTNLRYGTTIHEDRVAALLTTYNRLAQEVIKEAEETSS